MPTCVLKYTILWHLIIRSIHFPHVCMYVCMCVCVSVPRVVCMWLCLCLFACEYVLCVFKLCTCVWYEFMFVCKDWVGRDCGWAGGMCVIC